MDRVTELISLQAAMDARRAELTRRYEEQNAKQAAEERATCERERKAVEAFSEYVETQCGFDSSGVGIEATEQDEGAYSIVLTVQPPEGFCVTIQSNYEFRHVIDGSGANYVGSATYVWKFVKISDHPLWSVRGEDGDSYYRSDDLLEAIMLAMGGEYQKAVLKA